MSTTAFNSSTVNSSVPAVSHNAPVEIRAVFGTMACLPFLCNGVLCVVILRPRSMLSSSYNVLVVVLAITDALTGTLKFELQTHRKINPLQIHRHIITGELRGRD